MAAESVVMVRLGFPKEDFANKSKKRERFGTRAGKPGNSVIIALALPWGLKERIIEDASCWK